MNNLIPFRRLLRAATPPGSSEPANGKAEAELAAHLMRERMAIALRQSLRVSPALAAAAAGALWIWSTTAGLLTGALWLAACLLQTAFVWVAARRFSRLSDEDSLRSRGLFWWHNAAAGLLHGLLCTTFVWSVVAQLPVDARTSASVALLVLAGWIASSGTLLNVGFFFSSALPTVSLMALWWPDEPKSLQGYLGTATVMTLGLALIWMHREQELLLQRGVLLNARNAMLMREVMQRSHVIESINKKKTEIIAAASHDLRQPVHALGLLVQRLRPHLPEADQLSLFQMVRSRVSVISEMLSGLLDLSKLDSGHYQVKLEVVRLRDMVDEVVQLFEEKASRKGLALAARVDDVDIRTDPSLLKQVIHNLVSNAVKYTREGEVVIGGSHARQNHFAIEVRDTGAGIPQANLEEIFMEYYRLPPHRDGNEEGLGIGLTLVRRAAALMGYKIKVASRVGVGSRFTIRIPAQFVSRHVSMDVQAPETAPGDLDGNSQYTVLILENDEVANEAMVRLVSDWGYRVTSGVQGVKLLAHLREHPEVVPDVIVSDMHLGDGPDGLAFIAMFRQLLGLDDLPGVVVTGDLSRELQLRAVESRVRILYKPLQPRLLKIAIDSAIMGRVAIP